MIEQVFEQVVLLAGVDDPRKEVLLRLLCQAAVTELTSRLREGMTAEACKNEFIAAASLLALASMVEAEPMNNWQQIQLGDLSIRPQGSDVSTQCLRAQAEKLMLPYCEQGFSFLGV